VCVPKGGYFQPSATRVAATSSTPSASPWAFAVPARVGAPLPITVLQQMIVGLPLAARAFSIAAVTARESLPSTSAITFQP